ncbi:murein biosynthesis integral membrane protein MurJ [Xinfangfangia sp. CPCC 101601]|uniref:Probable lipid II flippase MurJ n=1 Tax=Pseudogemmobacter lacusdianii TaxID=3069608 RepID=A0ABU0W1R1_9RHOB|nr:murein biosynthesis integral membrane protein MurJ [Xinfangfangia sp. CPCC 101601]MDQ2067360.1 murein biosynthesis integral membrane protein MurJ [Xinfangfangia sp. CPCC 101601]
MKPMRLISGFLTVGFWTLISRIAGLVRDILMARFLGDGPVAEAFIVAQSLPNMFRRFFAEGAFNFAFVPMFAKKSEAKEDAEGFARDAYWGMAALLTVFSLLAIIAMPVLVLAMASGFVGDERFDLAVTMGRIAFPYILFISLTALLSGMLNAMGRFVVTSAVTVLLSLSLIAGMLLADRFGWDMAYTQAWAVSISGVLQLLVTWIAVRRLGFRLPFRMPRLTPELRRLAVIAAPAVLAGGVVQINLIVGRQVASATDGAMAWLYNADRLYQLPLGVVGIAIGIVLLPELSRRLRAADDQGSRDAYNRGTEFALLLTLPAAVALVVIAWPIITVVYERGAFGPQAAIYTAQALAVYGIGLPAFVLQKVLQPLYYAREDTRSPFRFAVWSMVVNLVIALALMPFVGFLAAAIATTASAWVMVWQLWRGTRAMGAAARFDARFVQRVPRIVVASALMGVVLWGLSTWLAPQLATPGPRTAALGVIVLAGIVTYFGSAAAIGAMSMAELKASLRRGRK